MATFSLCMIVKNEGKLLARCLDSVADLMDEIIIVDTGSTDDTKEIAAKYTNLIYDFTWVDDFAAARNFSFSKATMDYIYAPDADEVLDETNRRRLANLKEVILPEVEIVQMKYKTVTDFDTVLNAASEYRPKLFKRLREFTWVDPIHETIRLEPVVFDSDIEILHMPEQLHSKRDFSIFTKILAKEGTLSEKLLKMYAMELEKCGDVSDLLAAREYFSKILQQDSDMTHLQYAICILARGYRLEKNMHDFFKVALKDMGQTPCAEICFELGEYFMEMQDVSEASLWYYNAAVEAQPVLDIHKGGDEALKRLLESYEILQEQAENDMERDYFSQQAAFAKEQLEMWQMPEE